VALIRERKMADDRETQRRIGGFGPFARRV